MITRVEIKISVQDLTAEDFPELQAFDAGMRGEARRARTRGEMAEWLQGFGYACQRARLGVL